MVQDLLVHTLLIFLQLTTINIIIIDDHSTGGAIYGEHNYFPDDENHALQPLSAIY